MSFAESSVLDIKFTGAANPFRKDPTDVAGYMGFLMDAPPGSLRIAGHDHPPQELEVNLEHRTSPVLLLFRDGDGKVMWKKAMNDVGLRRMAKDYRHAAAAQTGKWSMATRFNHGPFTARRLIHQEGTQAMEHVVGGEIVVNRRSDLYLMPSLFALYALTEQAP